MKFSYPVEIREPVSIKHDVVATPHFGDTIDGKADNLIQAHAKIKQQQGHDHAVNHWRGDEILWTVLEHPRGKILHSPPQLLREINVDDRCPIH